MEHIQKTIDNLGKPSDILKRMSKESPVGDDSASFKEAEGCDICKGAGFVHPSHNGIVDYSTTIPCQCIKELQSQRRKSLFLKYCELPERAKDMSLSNFDVYPELKTAFNTAKQIASKPGKFCWATFMGDNDTGKTHLAISICKAWISEGIAAKYAYVPFLLDELREGYRLQDDNSYENRFKRLCEIPLLILDDLGKGKSSPWAIEKLETLVNYRTMEKLSLIVTTNKSIEWIQDNISMALGSRLVRYPETILVEINAKEYTLRHKR